MHVTLLCTTIMQQNFSIQKIPLCDKGVQSLEAEIDCFFWPVTPMDTSGEQRVDFDMNPLNGIMMKFKLHFNCNQCSPLLKHNR